MLFDRKHFTPLHRKWLSAVLLVLAVGALWFGWVGLSQQRLPGGGSWPGLTFGVAAGVICLFEFALVLRKTSWFRTRRTFMGLKLGTAQSWMAAHIWLGLFAAPLVAMHAGFRLGGTLSWLLAWVFILVIVSGVFGLVMQNVLPRLMTEAAPEETIYSQIDVVGRQFAADAVRLARLYGGPGSDDAWRELEESFPSQEVDKSAGTVVAGAPRRVGTMVSRSRHPQVDLPRGAQSPVLHQVLDDVVVFLSTGRGPAGKLDSVQQIEWYFDDLRRRVHPEARPAVDQMESLCLRRRQLNLQGRIHFWLHSWLSIHLPLSVALIWLLVAHVIGAVVYN